MGYFEHMKTLLAPLRLYDLESGIGAAELQILGNALDCLSDRLEELEREAVLTTAESYGLENYENLLPYKPAWSNTAQRQAALAALMRIDGRSFSRQALTDTLQGCGIRAFVRETDTPMTVEVGFPGTAGIPENLSALQERIVRILPCHLDILYVFVFLTWADLEARFPCWEQLEGLSWSALERSGPPMGEG